MVFVRPVTDAGQLRLAAMVNAGMHRGLEIAVLIVVLKLIWDVGKLVTGASRPGAMTAV